MLKQEQETSRPVPWAFMIGLGVLLLGLLISVFQRKAEDVASNRGAQMVWIAVGMLWAVAVQSLIRPRSAEQDPFTLHQSRVWALISGAIVSLMVLRSALDPEVNLRVLALFSVPWLSLVVFPVLADPRYEQSLDAGLRYFTILGVVLNLLFLREAASSGTLDDPRRGVVLPAVKAGQILLFALPYFLFRYRELGGVMRIAVAMGALELLFIGVTSATRQTITDIGLQIVILIGIYLRRRRAGEAAPSSLRRGMFNVAAIGVVLFSVVTVLPRIQSKVVETEKRFIAEGGDSSISENARWQEIGALLEQLEPEDYLWGRGTAGAFDNPIIPENTQYLHVGYMHALLKGGIPLVLLLLLGPVRGGIMSLVRSRSTQVLAAAGMCTLAGFKLISGNILAVNPTFLLVLICYGRCLAARRLEQLDAAR